MKGAGGSGMRIAPARARVLAAAVAWSLAGLALVVAAGRAQESEGPQPLLLDRAPEAVTIRVVPEPPPASLAGGEITVGDRLWVTVRTEGPPGYRLLPQSLIDAYAPHPELAVVGSDRRDGLLRLQIAIFRPGDLVLPAVRARVLTAAGDTVAVTTHADTIRVASVLAPGDTVLADIKPLWRPKGVPLWVWALLAAALLAAAALWWWRRRRARTEPAAPRAARDAYAEARARVVELAGEPADPVRAILAAAGIGDALRGYLADGWGLAARERTTFELLATLPVSLQAERASVGAILAAGDLAKFARVIPGRGEVPAIGGRALGLLDRLEAARRRSLAAAAETGEGLESPAVRARAAS
jgi:hypothetical protein